MFQAVPPPIIRSSKLYTQHRAFVELLMLPTTCASKLGLICMFQAVPPPIIRSSKPYTLHRVFVELFLFLTAIVSELEQLTYHSNDRNTGNPGNSSHGDASSQGTHRNGRHW